MTDHLPALESATINDMVRVNLNGLHVAGKGFMEGEVSEKVQKAQWFDVRT